MTMTESGGVQKNTAYGVFVQAWLSVLVSPFPSLNAESKEYLQKTYKENIGRYQNTFFFVNDFMINIIFLLRMIVIKCFHFELHQFTKGLCIWLK